MMLMKRSLLWAGPAAALALTLTACSGTPASGAGIDVVAEIYPLAWIAEQVGGDRVDVTTLVPPGTEVHTYEVSPQQVDLIGRADLAVVSAEVSAAVDDAVATNPPAATVDASTLVTLRPAAAGDEHAEEADGHDEATFDPHVWLDIPELPLVVDAVAAELARIDPEGADTYAANARALDAQLATLDEHYRAGLASCEQDTVIVTHPAFGYLAGAYGLEQVGISGFDEDTEPSPARLAEVSKVAQEHGATTVFFPDTSSSKVADVLAGDLGLQVGELSTITGVADGQDYLTVSERNLEALRAGLGCS
jgi:zinc transport system substrate-binding protein